MFLKIHFYDENIGTYINEINRGGHVILKRIGFQCSIFFEQLLKELSKAFLTNSFLVMSERF